MRIQILILGFKGLSGDFALEFLNLSELNLPVWPRGLLSSLEVCIQ